MVKVGQMDGEKVSLKRETVWVWATEQVGLLVVNCATVRAAVVLKRIVSVDSMVSREPPVDVLQYLLVLQRCLFLERGEEDWPRDKLPSVDGPLEFLVYIFPKTGSCVRCIKESVQGRADMLAEVIDINARSWEDNDLVDRS